MSPTDFAAIEQQARRLRDAELLRIQGLISARLRVHGQRLLGALHSGFTILGENLRPLFSWNPRAGHSS